MESDWHYSLSSPLNSQYPTPETLNLNTKNVNAEPYIPSTINPEPKTLSPQTYTLNPQPSTLNPKPKALNLKP